MKAARWLSVWLVLLVASGCAQRSDWIESTLVTVDVAGRWTGNWSGSGGGGDFAMTLRQTGRKATGDVQLITGDAHNWNGSILGTVRGDVLTFSLWDGRLRGEVIVAGDEMSGTVTFTPVTSSGCCPGGGMTGTKALKLQRQPVPAAVPPSRRNADLVGDVEHTRAAPGDGACCTRHAHQRRNSTMPTYDPSR
jgi:hypothetical protein